MRKVLLIGLVVMVLGVGAAMAIPISRIVIIGFMRGEPFSEGMPRSYWLEQIKSPDARERKEAAWALRGFKDNEAVQALIAALKDQDKLVRMDASYSLSKVGSPDGDEAIPALIERLGDADDGYGHALNLQVFGAAAVPELIKALSDKNPHTRRNAAATLGMIEPPAVTAVAALAERLRDSDQGVRDETIKTLGRIGPGAQAAIPGLLEIALRDQDRYQLETGFAAVAVAEIDSDGELVPKLIGNLSSDSAPIRYKSANVLGHYGPRAKAAVPALIKVLQDENRDVRRFTADALKKIDPEAAAKAGVR